MDAEIFNHALNMSLEWGPTLGKPIQERLRADYPDLTSDEADAYDLIARESSSYAFEQIEHAYVKKISPQAASANVKARYPLMDDQTLSRLWSQGQYYAWRENG